MFLADAPPAVPIGQQLLSAVLPSLAAAIIAGLSLAAVWFKAKLSELQRTQDSHAVTLKDQAAAITKNAADIVPPPVAAAIIAAQSLPSVNPPSIHT
jgi:hypothetical protein